jgi:hypothetical protein
MISQAIDSAVLAVYRLLYIFQKPFTPGEIFLNILFICLIIIISLIIYWDTINVRVAKTSRCKRQMDIFNKNKGMYIINAKDKSKQPLYAITYDTKQNNTNVECTCNSGKYINYFNSIPVKNLRTNKDVQVDKVCQCDKYYNVGMMTENVIYDGEPGIVRYMQTPNDSSFFDALVYTPYT